MMLTKRSLAMLLLILVLLGLPFSQALAKEITRVSVSGPGLPGEIELSDVQDIAVASAPWMDFLTTTQPAGMENASYYVVHLEIAHEGEMVGASVLHYYPGDGDQPGYFFYADCQGCTGSFQTWIRVLPQQDLALRELLVNLGAPATLIGGEKQAGIRLDSIFLQSRLWMITLLALALLAVGGLFFISLRVREKASS